MSAEDREKWDGKYSGRSAPDELQPDEWLTTNLKDAPPGRALELACGLGGNAIWLARQGWRVDAVDVSPVGLEIAERFARTQHADVRWIAADLDDYTPEREVYDLVVVFRFLDRKRLPEIVTSALKPGGRLIYETFAQAHLDRPENHLRNPAFTLAPGELPAMFPQLRTVDDREVDLPDRNVARLVAER